MSTPGDFALLTQMARHRSRQVNQRYDQPQQRSRGGRLESIPEEMVNNGVRVQPDQEDTTGNFNLPPLSPELGMSCLELPRPQFTQPASAPASGVNGIHRHVTCPYYYQPQVSTDIDPHPITAERSPSQPRSDWPLAGSSYQRVNHRASSALQFRSPFTGYACIQTQPNTNSDFDPRTGYPLARSSHWRNNSGMSPTYQFRNPSAGCAGIRSHLSANQSNSSSLRTIMGSTSGDHSQVSDVYNQVHMIDNHGVNQMVPLSRPQAGVSSYGHAAFPVMPSNTCTNWTGDAGFGEPNSISHRTDAGSGWRGNNNSNLDVSHCRTSAAVNNCTDANMIQGSHREEISKPEKRRAGRPRGSSSANKDKSSAPTTMEVSVHHIQIGKWQPEDPKDTKVSTKCYLKRRKLVWEILSNKRQLKQRMIIDWKSIESMKSIPELFQLRLKLSEPPSFSDEIIKKVSVHSSWKPCEDFTDGQASRTGVVHTLVFEPEMYKKYIEHLRKIEKLRHLLIKGMRKEDSNVAGAPNSYASIGMSEEAKGSENAHMYNTQMDEHEPLWSNQVPCDIPPVQIYEPGPSDDSMALAVVGGSIDDDNGMTLPVTASSENGPSLPETENPQNAPLESPSSSWDLIDISFFQ